MSTTNTMDATAHHLATSMSPAQMGLVTDPNHTQSSYAMPPQHSFGQNPYAVSGFPTAPQALAVSPINPRKRRRSDDTIPNNMSVPLSAGSTDSSLYGRAPDNELLRQFDMEAAVQQQNQHQHHAQHQQPDPDLLPPPAKKSRVNTPWTPAEEHRLKILRDQGQSWAEIAKSFPNRTEGSVKKHWYKVPEDGTATLFATLTLPQDMHYAEFAQDESAALLHAIRDYEQSKWKVIGLKVGKPAKACEQYAREHFTKDQIAGKVKPEPPGKGNGGEPKKRSQSTEGDLSIQ